MATSAALFTPTTTFSPSNLSFQGLRPLNKSKTSLPTTFCRYLFLAMGFLITTKIRKTVLSIILYIVVLNFFFGINGSNAQILPSDEVQALKAIADKLQIDKWNIRANASMDGGLEKNGTDKLVIFAKCNCSFEGDTVCHVTKILLKMLSLKGEIPDEFANLTFLQELDLTRNYFNGTIPISLARLPLVNLSMLGNRLNGSIPKELGNISTLEYLNVEDNLLGGSLPESLGNLSRLKRLLITANNFTGKIPESFGKLKELTDFRADGNTFSGKFPSFIGNWTKLDRLDMQGTSMEGPIPSTISLLKNLTQLMISDLSGSSSTFPFPDLSDMKSMKALVLRNCLITGSIPDYIRNMTDLKKLDLSFNQLSGPIPVSIQRLEKLRFVFLTNNSLTGAVPDKLMKISDKKIDLSYNNFTGTPESSCQQTTRKASFSKFSVLHSISPLNLASSYPSTENSVDWCLKKGLPCSHKPKYHSLFINCGGQRVTYDKNEYSEDTSGSAASYFFPDSERWAFSSTGVFLGDEKANNTATNVYSLNITGPKYYQNARLAATSLKYYGLCLRKGNYNVKLHFAEIMYTNDQTYKSLGKRLFDVYIQGKRYLKDFNIAEEAGGVGKNITKDYDIDVNETTLEIHLYWAGKGTTALPERGVYGPLISAISVTPKFKVDTGELSGGAIAGIVISSFVVVALILLVLRMKGYLGGKDDQNIELLDLKTGYFSLKQIRAATNNFDPANKIGEGGFGPVYKGTLSDGVLIAVKQLSSKSKQGNREFVNEIGMISAVQHPNLVKLYGCCIEGNQLMLVYEYLENNSLARALFGPEDQRLNLDWKTRKNICLDIARGLAYLHEESRLKIVHRDIKATNVLLGKDLNAKISDFGLAKLDEEENTHISTRIAGTFGYMAPEYAMRGYLTDKADVYSFGVVVLEIVSGKSNTNYRPGEEVVYLLDWACDLQEQCNILDLVDPSLSSKYSKEEALRLLNISLLCTNTSPSLRPLMSSVVSMVNGFMPIEVPLVKENSRKMDDAVFKSHETISQDDSSNQTQVSTFSNNSQVKRSMFWDGPWTSSSTSAKDLYDINLE